MAASAVLLLMMQGKLGPQGPVIVSPSLDWTAHLGGVDQLLNVLLVVCSTLIVANLERTLRNAVGRFRWQIKFMVIGLGVFFAVRIYSASYSLLTGIYTSELLLVESLAVLAGAGLATISLQRSRTLDIDIYLSPTALHRSVAVVGVGVYLIAVGLATQLIAWLGWTESLPLQTLVVFLALAFLTVALLSDRLQQSVRTGVNRHLRRPVHDYRRIWNEFTRRTAGLTTVPELCRTVATIVSEQFQSHSVGVWTWEESRGAARLVASTALSLPAEASPWRIDVASPLPIGEVVVDLSEEQHERMAGFIEALSDYLERSEDRYLVPVRAGETTLGFITLGQRVRHQELTFEDRELLTMMARQLGSLLLNLRLSDQLQKSREMEAFQTVSTFFVHDLKNVTSRLSLAVKNLPRHFDNPDFRSDMLRTISESIEKMQEMSGRLSEFKDGLKLERQAIDVNEFVSSTLDDVLAGLSNRIELHLGDIPEQVLADPDQLSRVLENLLLNAQEASSRGGHIRVATAALNGSASIEVADSGCGMSPDFVEKRLFQPFQTTKKRGIGIGLYQSRAIVEAHGGRLEVESEEGVGSRFRIVLPLGEDAPARDPET